MKISELEKGLVYWRLLDELTIVQAALLVCDPTSVHFYEHAEEWENKPAGYDAARMAISRALLRDEIMGNMVFVQHPDYASFIDGNLDHNESNVNVASLRDWLAGRGIKTGFFFPEAIGSPDYLDPNHSHYAPKLAAAISVWEAVVTDPNLMRGTTAKQAMIKWLRRNADRYGLTKDDGNPNEQGIEEVAKVANWADKGGAPKTPAG